MALQDKLNAMVTSYNAMLGALLGKLSLKANKTDVYNRSYLDDSTNTIGANAATAGKLKSPISITFTGDATGSAANVDGSANVSISMTVAALADKADATTVYTKAETDARIQNVVDAAPAALDTLNELAAALGDDPNFAGTVTAQLGEKANSADVYDKSASDLRFLAIGGTAVNANKLGNQLPSYYASASDLNATNTSIESVVDTLKTTFDDATTVIEAT